MSQSPARERFVVEVEVLPDPDGATAGRRVAGWLKVGLRSFGIRVVRQVQTFPPLSVEPPAQTEVSSR